MKCSEAGSSPCTVWVGGPRGLGRRPEEQSRGSPAEGFSLTFVAQGACLHPRLPTCPPALQVVDLTHTLELIP